MSIPVVLSKGHQEQGKAAGSGGRDFFELLVWGVFIIFKLSCTGIAQKAWELETPSLLSHTGLGVPPQQSCRGSK